MTRSDWDAEWARVYDAYYYKKRDHSWAMAQAHEMMARVHGPRPEAPKEVKPTLGGVVRLGLEIKRFKMGTYKNPAAWLTAAAAAFATASAQYGLAVGDGVITGAEWGGIAIQFITMLLGTATKFTEKRAVDNDGQPVERRQ